MLYYQSSLSWWILKALCEKGGLEIREVKDYVIKKTGEKEKDIVKRIKSLVKSHYMEVTYESVDDKLWGDKTGLQIKESGQQIYLYNQAEADQIIKAVKQIIKEDRIVFECKAERTDVSNWSGGIYYIDKKNSSRRSSRLYFYLSCFPMRRSIEEFIFGCAYSLMALVGEKYKRSGTTVGKWRYLLFAREFEKRCKYTEEGKKFFKKTKKDIATKTLSCIFGNELSLSKDNLAVLIAHEHPIVRIMSKALIN